MDCHRLLPVSCAKYGSGQSVDCPAQSMDPQFVYLLCLFVCMVLNFIGAKKKIKKIEEQVKSILPVSFFRDPIPTTILVVFHRREVITNYFNSRSLISSYLEQS